jgi:site-specific DNA-methyltransferase (adenine-specific)
VDASRIHNGPKAKGTQTDFAATRKDFKGFGFHGTSVKSARHNDVNQGRFPANLVLSHHPECREQLCLPFCPVAELDRQSGTSRSPTKARQGGKTFASETPRGDQVVPCFGDSGGASRFFYVAKPSRSERNAGCEGLPKRKAGIGDDRPSGQSMQRLDGRAERAAQNVHPTVKPIKLMRYLITMVTPPGGVVLDPFTGSGSTGVAAFLEGFAFLGIERERDYVRISRARLAHAKRTARKPQEKGA